MNNRTIIMIAMVAVVMMIGHTSATIHVLSEPATNFTEGTYKAGAVIPVVTFGINQTANETLESVAVTVINESGSDSPVPADFASLKVYRENGTTAGFQPGDTEVGSQTAVNVSSTTNISTGTTSINTTETTFYVVMTLAATPGDAHQFSVDMAADGVVTNASSPTVAALDGAVIATIDTTAPTMSSAARVNNTRITVTMSEAVTTLGIADGGFIVAKNGDPGTNYTVSAIAAGGSANLVVLTVADIGGSIATGVNVTYNTTGANATIIDMAGNVLATNTDGVIVAAWQTSSSGSSGSGSGTYPPGWGGTPTATVTATKAPTPSTTATDAPPGESVKPRLTPTKAKPEATKATAPATEGATVEAPDKSPGFTTVFVIAGMLAVAYAMMRRRG